jgi:hypothetical protein
MQLQNLEAAIFAFTKGFEGDFEFSSMSIFIKMLYFYQLLIEKHLKIHIKTYFLISPQSEITTF